MENGQDKSAAEYPCSRVIRGLSFDPKKFIMKKLTPCITILLALLLSLSPVWADCDCPQDSTTDIPPGEYAALSALYTATDGDNWTDNSYWLSSFPVSSWHGITVANGHVTGVVLPSNNLKGSIPPELGNLPGLLSLMLDSNDLTGEIPAELGNINTLLLIWLDGNSLSGDLPLFLADPPEYLDLRYNHLTASDQAVLDAVELAHTYRFRSTQTIPPENLVARAAEIDGRLENRIELSWDPINYVGDEGGYQVFYKKTTDPDYQYYADTADKASSSITVSDLEPGIAYDFKVRSVTWAHDYQKLIPS